jgi:hypothetical protein
MLTRRRPVASMFAALLVWLTAVGVVRVAHPNEMRLIGIEAEGTTQTVIAPARAMDVAPRLPSRSSTIPLPDVPLAADPPLVLLATPRVALAPALLARVRHQTGLASTYYATAPPLGGR